jgi:hypothetical protein
VPRWDRCIDVLRDYVEEIMILQWNKRAAFNLVKTTNLIFIT